MSFLDRIRAANRCDLKQFRSFTAAGQRVGFVHHSFAETLKRWSKVFAVDEQAVCLSPELEGHDVTVEQRSDAVREVILELRSEGAFGDFWWDENYAVNPSFEQAPYLLLERAAIQHFGINGYGVHLNGYVRSEAGLHMWVGRRARDKPTGPGKLDQIVAGGQPAGLSLQENMVKECAEEAGMAAELAQRVVPVGAVSYCLQTDYGLRPDVLYVFDLELPADFVPVNTDGEVEEFYLWPIEQVAEIVHDSDEFKFNCSLVVIDFLLRHGVIDPAHPDYLALLSGLRQREYVLNQLNFFERGSYGR